MKKIIAIFLITIMAFNFYVSTDAVNVPFRDLNEDFWGKPYIDSMVQSGYLKGYPDNTIKPNNNITRIEFLVMFSRILSNLYKDKVNLTVQDTENAYIFNDVKSVKWALEDYKKAAVYLYLLNGKKTDKQYGQRELTYIFGDKLEPSKKIIRGEVIALLHEIFDVSNISNENGKLTDISNYKFNRQILDFEAIGIADGYPNNTFKPNNVITRTEAANLVSNAVAMTNMIKYISYYDSIILSITPAPDIQYNSYLSPVDVIKKVLELERNAEYANAYKFYSSKSKEENHFTSYLDYKDNQIIQVSYMLRLYEPNAFQYKEKPVNKDTTLVYFRKYNPKNGSTEKIMARKLVLENGKWYVDFKAVPSVESDWN